MGLEISRDTNEIVLLVMLVCALPSVLESWGGCYCRSVNIEKEIFLPGLRF